MNLYDYHSEPSKLIGGLTPEFLIPVLACSRLMRNPNDPDKTKLEKVIATDKDLSLMYATKVLHNKRFELGEPAIAKSADASWHYVDTVLKDRFKLGEPVLFANPWYREQYFKNLRKHGKWDDSILDDFEKWKQTK